MTRLPPEAETRTRAQRRARSPAQVIVLSFLGAITVGTIVLSLPVAHAPGAQIGVLDALFTATSAVCVTGLVVVDTGAAFSTFGKIVIMLLIKSGGLGILTVGALLAFASGRRVGFQERMRLQAQVNALQVGGVVRLVRNIAILTVAVEVLGAIFLYLRFAPRHGAADGVLYALFHSISAFNNAGFALYADSLMRHVRDPLVSLTIAALIILGGLGFFVIIELLSRVRKSHRAPLSLHTKMVLSATAVLVAAATVILLALEWTNPQTLGPLSLPSRLLAGFFQAVTPRTAGFNTLDYGDMRVPSLVFTMLLMFVGGNPGSAAGGIKTVTFFVLVGSAWSLSRGRGELTLFGRRISMSVVVKAGVIALMGMMFVGAALTALAVTDAGTAFLPLAFETVSAFGTVGLSLGITADLSAAGKLIIIALMYLGRVGLLTFALALVAKQAEKSVRYPEEDVVIG